MYRNIPPEEELRAEETASFAQQNTDPKENSKRDRDTVLKETAVTDAALQWGGIALRDCEQTHCPELQEKKKKATV